MGDACLGKPEVVGGREVEGHVAADFQAAGADQSPICSGMPVQCVPTKVGSGVERRHHI